MYGPQHGRSFILKELFYDELRSVWGMYSVDELVVFLVDLNMHVGKHSHGIDGVHGVYAIGQSNFEERFCTSFIFLNTSDFSNGLCPLCNYN